MLLSNPIDPSSPKFWNMFRTHLLQAKPGKIDRNGVMNLNLMIPYVHIDSERIKSFSYFLRLFKDILGDDIGFEIGKLINTLVFKDKCMFEKETSDLLKVVGLLCSNKKEMKEIIMKKTVKKMSKEMLCCLKLPKSIISALFQLQIILISQCPNNRNLVPSYFNEKQLSNCLKLIQKNNDSLTQVLLVEWMWRIISCLDQTIDLNKIFGQFASSFSQINSSNFRESIHSFIMNINQKAKIPISSNVIHVKFNKFYCNNVLIEEYGWLDINQDTLVAFLTKKEIDSPMPDVVVFRMTQLNNEKSFNNTFSFITKERLIVFEAKTNEYPLQIKFKLEGATNVVHNEILRRCEKYHVNLNEERLIDFDEKETKLPERRIYAKKKEETMITTPEIYQKGCVNAINEKRENNNEISLHKIESILGIYQQKTLESINTLENQITNQLNNIIARSKEHQKVLLQLSQQHNQITESTSKENQLITKTIVSLENDFQTRHNETIQKRNTISDRAINEINIEKLKFIEETNHSFDQNAIIFLANNLGNLQEMICENIHE